MKEKIFDILKDETKALAPIDIYNLLKLKTADELRDLTVELEDMQANGEIYKTNRDKYILFSNCPGVYCGKISVNKKGYGFVLLPMQDDLFIPQVNLNNAINGDLVVCEIVKKGLKPEGRVVRILKRDLKNIVGTVEYNKKGILLFTPDDKDLNVRFKLDTSTTKNCVDGSKVLIQVGKDLGNNIYDATVLKVLGHKNDPGMDIKSIAYRYGIYDQFSAEVEKELDAIPTEVCEKDKIGRTDLTNKMIFTIDGDDTKDIDDAISIKEIEDGYILGVHIADVSYYVKENTAIGDEAFLRGTSSYLADTVIPMISHKLSNGICSLNEGVERLTISCVMKIDNQGNTLSADIFPSFIKSRKKMSYKNVNKILMENIIPEGYEEYADTLKKMNELAKILRKRMISRGYIDFDLDEPKIIQNENGESIDVVKVEHKDGEKLIECFMIAANEAVASYIYNLDLPFIYRVHDVPNEEKINEFSQLVKQFGYKLNTRLRSVTPKVMQKMLNELRDKPEFKILSGYLLRSMKKAIYSKDNIGHFGLASDCYTHFTSPIRRFPDLTVHRLLRNYIFENNLSMNVINYYNSALVQIAEHSSEREQAAINAERDVDDMKMAEYMEKHVGEQFDGIITNVSNFGFFVQLPNLVEGLVHVKSLIDDYYNYVPEMLSLVGQSSNKIYRIGDEVHIKVVGASKINSTVDFEIQEVKDGNTKQRS